jgi:hypothetical protein
MHTHICQLHYQTNYKGRLLVLWMGTQHPNLKQHFMAAHSPELYSCFGEYLKLTLVLPQFHLFALHLFTNFHCLKFLSAPTPQTSVTLLALQS